MLALSMEQYREYHAFAVDWQMKLQVAHGFLSGMAGAEPQLSPIQKAKASGDVTPQFDAAVQRLREKSGKKKFDLQEVWAEMKSGGPTSG